MSANREDLEQGFAFIGFLIMENKLKPISTRVIDILHAAEIRTIMVTGDNLLTALSVAQQCHIVGQNQTVFLVDINENDEDIRPILSGQIFEFSKLKLNKDFGSDLDINIKVLITPDLSNNPLLKNSQQQSLFHSTLDLNNQEDYCMAITGIFPLLKVCIS